MKNKLCKFILFTFILSLSVSNLLSKNNTDTLKLFLFSDPHYFDPSLGTETELFQKEQITEMKMHKQSKEIINKTVEIILKENVDIILIPGDLTKDGEKKSHEMVSKYLSKIEKSGKRVFVIPGNHDINNDESFTYSDNKNRLKTPTTSPKKFKELYKDFGYEEALYKDSNSLSYIAELNKNTWLLAMAPLSSKSRLKPKSVRGEFTSSTLNWVKSKLIEAQKKNITVFGMIHHSILEHFPYMDIVRKGRLLNDWKKITPVLLDHGLNIVFTGHIHANDIVKYKKNNNFIIDILTGSTIIWPCSYRLINYNKNSKELLINTKNINFQFLETDLQNYAYEFINKQFPIFAKKSLIQMGFNDQTIKKILPLLVKTYIAFYHGDESKNQNKEIIKSINFLLNDKDEMKTFFAKVLLGIWNDDTPDRNVKINLNNGTIESLK